MPDITLSLEAGLAARIAQIVRDARALIGWSQHDLADRSATSQSMISRIEGARAKQLDVLVVERVLQALGVRLTLKLDARHLEDRRRQNDAVHARLTGYLARRLEHDGWTTATEVPLGEGVPRGWIDLLAFRPADRALLVEETKTDLPDLGALQRSLAFYEREAWAAAKQLGWRPARIAVLCVALDSDTIARRLADGRDLVERAFPGVPSEMLSWLTSPGSAAPRGWTLATADPLSRGRTWLHATTLGGRRRPPAYAGYADAAARLRRS